MAKKKLDVSTMTHEELEMRYAALLNKFANWPIKGIDREDMMQELRLVLHKAHKKFDSSRGTQFITYLYSAFRTTMYWHHERKSTKAQIVSLENTEALNIQAPEDNSLFELIGLASPQVRALAYNILNDLNWRELITDEEMNNTLEELVDLLSEA